MHGANVSDDVSILADLAWRDAVLNSVEENHLASDERPGPGQRFGKVQEDVPEPVHRCPERGQCDDG